MNDAVFNFIEMCLGFHIVEILFGLAVILVVIDYLFPTDLPAHIGYICMSAAVFFVAYLQAYSLGWCLFAAIAFWILLAMLHQAWFRSYLENAPGTPGYDERT